MRFHTYQISGVLSFHADRTADVIRYNITAMDKYELEITVIELTWPARNRNMEPDAPARYVYMRFANAEVAASAAYFSLMLTKPPRLGDTRVNRNHHFTRNEISRENPANYTILRNGIFYLKAHYRCANRGFCTSNQIESTEFY